MPKTAKNLILNDWNDKPVDFFKFQEKNHLILIFYRGYWCNICRAQLDEFNKNLDKTKAKIIAISGDEPLYASLLSTHLGAKFPILPDPELKSFKIYELDIPDDKKDILPAIFIVSPKHEIIYKNISENPEKRPDLSKILAQIP
ncbi:MAG: redoxin domain-containing protein [Patescibacteria group bacterium]|nr:redoxin domain-containing protein [Patescibacteria group bacterium]